MDNEELEQSVRRSLENLFGVKYEPNVRIAIFNMGLNIIETHKVHYVNEEFKKIGVYTCLN